MTMYPIDEIAFYEDKRDQFRWTYRNKNNDGALADSGEGYIHLMDAVIGACRVIGKNTLDALYLHGELRKSRALVASGAESKSVIARPTTESSNGIAFIYEKRE